MGHGTQGTLPGAERALKKSPKGTKSALQKSPKGAKRVLQKSLKSAKRATNKIRRVPEPCKKKPDYTDDAQKPL